MGTAKCRSDICECVAMAVLSQWSIVLCHMTSLLTGGILGRLFACY